MLPTGQVTDSKIKLVIILYNYANSNNEVLNNVTNDPLKPKLVIIVLKHNFYI